MNLTLPFWRRQQNGTKDTRALNCRVCDYATQHHRNDYLKWLKTKTPTWLGCPRVDKWTQAKGQHASFKTESFLCLQRTREIARQRLIFSSLL